MKKANKDEIRIHNWIANWKKTLFLHDWDIRVLWSLEDEGTRVGHTECTIRYYEATITLYPGLVKQTLDVQWCCIVHELTHVLLAHLQCLGQKMARDKIVTEEEYTDVLEQTTTRLSNILTNAWPVK